MAVQAVVAQATFLPRPVVRLAGPQVVRPALIQAVQAVMPRPMPPMARAEGRGHLVEAAGDPACYTALPNIFTTTFTVISPLSEPDMRPDEQPTAVAVEQVTVAVVEAQADMDLIRQLTAAAVEVAVPAALSVTVVPVPATVAWAEPTMALRQWLAARQHHSSQM